MVLTTSKKIFYKIDKILGTKIIIAPISAAKQRINVALLAVSFAILKDVILVKLNQQPPLMKNL